MKLIVNGTEIPEEAVTREVERLRHGYEEYVRANGGEPDEAQLRDWAVEGLVENEVVRQEARATQPIPSEARIRQELTQYADAYSSYPETERIPRAREGLQVRRYLKEIRKGVTAPDEAAAKAYFDAHAELFTVSEGLRLEHVCRFVDLVSRPSIFMSLLQLKSDVEAGRVDWRDEALPLYSETYARDGGAFAVVTRGELPEAIERDLFALQPGQWSEVVDFGEGMLHLFKVTERLPSRALSFEEVRETVIRSLHQAAAEEAAYARIDELKTKAAIVREA
ncbi:MAG: peptidylprolyl isomerase [Kiritimatiellia bacterium]|jgi:hypothetical protein|nr:peptidylprolyl isomerase [Kiritimatiellia bacterium]